jgi:isoleucyl-tRNA synthetase
MRIPAIFAAACGAAGALAEEALGACLASTCTTFVSFFTAAFGATVFGAALGATFFAAGFLAGAFGFFAAGAFFLGAGDIRGGESYAHVRTRVLSFLFDIEKQYSNKRILIVTHGAPAWLMMTGAEWLSKEETLSAIRDIPGFHYFKNAEIKKCDFVPFPHNEFFELDPHRPYIDSVVLEKGGKEFHRVKEVMDVWFDSGAMPFAQEHYPFNTKSTFSPQKKLLTSQVGYPADFISEAIDQTRGWFYTLLAVGTLMDCGTPYKNVICLGHLLDKDGKKMSKSIGNIVDPWEQMEKYGVDVLRLWMFSINQPGEGKNYDEAVVCIPANCIAIL